jgi:phage-related protein
MRDVGVGVQEIRIRTDRAYRILYVAKSEEAVYVLHAFEKRTSKTSKGDLELGRRRYRDLIYRRQVFHGQT